MRAALFYQHGGPEVIRVEDVPRPAPGPDDILVEVRAASLNHLDLWVRAGLPIETVLPHIGGSDVAGVVAEVGDNVKDVQVGQRIVLNPSLWCGQCEWCRRGEECLCEKYRILGEHTQGGFAEFVVAPARNAYPIPDDVSFENAAAVPLVFGTAWRALMSRANLQREETLLITGASGGVSTAAIQIAKWVGARVFAVTTGKYIDRVRKLGADVVYDRTQVDFSRETWQETKKRGVDVVLDSVGGAVWQQIIRAAARLGRIVIYGATTGPKVETDLRVVFWKQLSILGTTMSNQAEFTTVMDLVFSGRFEPVVDRVFSLDQTAQAHEYLEEGEHFGKVIIRI